MTQTVLLGDLVNIRSGKSRPKNEGKFPVYGGNGIFDTAPSPNMNEPAVVIGRVGAYCGSVYIENKPFWLSDNALGVTTKKETSLEFIYYLLRSLDLNNKSVGGAQPLLNQGILNSISVTVPNLDLQKRIAEILGTIDQKIELNRKMNETLEQTGQALFRRYFIDNPDAEKWQDTTVSDLLKIRNGFAFKSEDYVESGIPLVRTTNFTEDNSIILQDPVYISIENSKKYNSFQLEERDLLVVMVGASLGKTVITPSNILPALQNQNMWCFRPHSKENKNYVMYKMLQIVKDNNNSASGSAREFFRKDYFYKLGIKLPDAETISRFNVQIDPIFDLINSNISEIQTLTTIRNTLLPRLMNGKVYI